jgi:hypothetical protein
MKTGNATSDELGRGVAASVEGSRVTDEGSTTTASIAGGHGSVTSTATPTSRVFGLAMILGPVVSLVSTVVYVLGGGLNKDQAGGVIQIYGVVGYAIAIIGLLRLLEKPMPRLSAALTVLGMVTVAAGLGFGNDSIVRAVNPDVALSQSHSAAATFALVLPGLTFPLTWIGLGLGLAKTGVISRWSGFAIAAGGLLFPVARIPGIDALALIADVVLLLGVVPIGLAVLTGRHTGSPGTPSIRTRLVAYNAAAIPLSAERI